MKLKGNVDLWKSLELRVECVSDLVTRGGYELVNQIAGSEIARIQT